jgi:hypothetical protein
LNYEETAKKAPGNDNLKQGITRAIENALNDKLDKRLLKNIDFNNLVVPKMID